MLIPQELQLSRLLHCACAVSAAKVQSNMLRLTLWVICFLFIRDYMLAKVTRSSYNTG